MIIFKSGSNINKGSAHNLIESVGEVNYNTVGTAIPIGDLFGLANLPNSAKRVFINVRLRHRFRGDQLIGDRIDITFNFLTQTPFTVALQAEQGDEYEAEENFNAILEIPSNVPGIPDPSVLNIDIAQTGAFVMDGDVLVSTMGYEQ